MLEICANFGCNTTSTECWIHLPDVLDIPGEGVWNREKFVKLDLMKPDGWFNTRRLLIDSIRIQMNAALSLGDENQMERILVGLTRSNGLDIVIEDRPYWWVVLILR